MWWENKEMDNCGLENSRNKLPIYHVLTGKYKFERMKMILNVLLQTVQVQIKDILLVHLWLDSGVFLDSQKYFFAFGDSFT